MLRLTSLAILASAAAIAPAQLVLPYSGTDAGATISSFQIIKSGTAGRANTLYITNAANTSDVLLVNTVGTGRAGYFSINNTASSNPALRADSNGSGTGVFGFMTGTGRAGSFRITNAANTNAALFAQTNGTGPALLAMAGFGLAADFQGAARFSGNVETLSRVSIGAGPNPVFPLDFSEALGNKISLWGTDPNQHYGLGIQGGQLQIFSDANASAVSIGYGGSTNFTERVRFESHAIMTFLPLGQDITSTIRAPWDLRLVKDFDDNNNNVWLRFYTNGTLEQVRIEDGNEAPALFDGAVIANGIDFAEGFKVLDSSIEPGDLVVNYGLDWEVVAKSTKPYEAGVIGVVSTKPAFIAGMSFDAEDKIDPELTRRRDAARRAGNEKLEKELTLKMRQLVEKAYRPIAFVGRVPVKVMGPVRVGDRLTASSVPGVAMAMTKAGQSVGIALEPNAGGYGKIMVMVQPGHYTPIATTNPIGDRTLASKVERLSAENAELRRESAERRRETAELKDRLERIEALLRSRR